jgi:hypothetical protein
MEPTLRHKLLTYLGGIAIALASSSTSNIGSELGMIPEPIIEELLGEIDSEKWTYKDLISFAELLSEDPRKQIRRHAARLFINLQPDFLSSNPEPIFAKMAQDKDPVVRSTLAWGLAQWLSHLNGLQRTNLVLEWVLSNNASLRQIVAKALSWEVNTLGVDLAIEHLANDQNANVRTAVVEAVENRVQDNPALYSGILSRLTSDKAPSVRKSARRAARRLRLA